MLPILIIIGISIVVLVLLLVLACCQATKRADEASAKFFNDK